MLHTVTHRHTVTHLPFPLCIKVIWSSCCTQIINFSYTPYTPYTPSILTAYTPLHTRYSFLTFQSVGPTQGKDWNRVTHPTHRTHLPFWQLTHRYTLVISSLHFSLLVLHKEETEIELHTRTHHTHLSFWQLTHLTHRYTPVISSLYFCLFGPATRERDWNWVTHPYTPYTPSLPERFTHFTHRYTPTASSSH